jgi:glycosyltransferase involved in cell wall biosynthesis
MKITFVIPDPGLSGGVLVVYEYANRLKDRGHDVSIIYPLIPMKSGAKWYNVRVLANRIIGVLLNMRRRNDVNWFDLKAKLIRKPSLDGQFIPDADIIVATWWATAEYVAKYKPGKGQKHFLIQHYEIWGGPKERVENTYKLGLHNIVISSWLRNILYSIGAPVESIILDAVDHSKFYPDRKERYSSALRILMPYRLEKWKGVEDGIRAFEIAKNRNSAISLVMFGPAPAGDIPEYVEFHKSPYGETLRKLYSSCDIFLFPSRKEGFGLPPLEAMACRCAVVATNVGGIPDYAVDGKTALISPPDEPEKLAENLVRLIEDEQLRRQIAQAACEYVQQFTWERATNELELMFKKSLIKQNLIE